MFGRAVSTSVCGSVHLSEGSCLVWLMEVPTEAELPWLLPQAALGFSLTYDNTPVTRYESLAAHLLRMAVFALLPDFPLLPSTSAFPSSLLICSELACFIRHRISSDSADSAVELTTADGGQCWIPPPLLTTAAVTLFNSVFLLLTHWDQGWYRINCWSFHDCVWNTNVVASVHNCMCF